MNPTTHDSVLTATSESGASEYSSVSGSDGSPPSPPSLISITGFTTGTKHCLKLITSDFGPGSQGTNSPSPSNDSESQPPTPAESELLTPLSQHDSSPIYTSPASFNVPLYAPSSRACGSSPSQAQNAYQATFPPAVNNPVAHTCQSPKRLCPDTGFRFPPASPTAAPIGRSRLESSHTDTPSSSSGTGITSRVKITHPYARLYAKNSKEAGAAKRRRMWNHALEKSFFTPQELSTMGAPQRRTIYTSSLEAHVDLLHKQLEESNLFPVLPEQLEPYRGLNSKTAKSMVAGLQKDMTEMKLKALELERSNHALRGCIMAHAGSNGVPHFPQTPTSSHSALARRHSVDSSLMSHLNMGA